PPTLPLSLHDALPISKLSQADVQIDAATLHLDARRKIEAFSDILASLAANLSLNAKGVSAKGIRVDALSLAGKLDGPRAEIAQLDRKSTRLNSSHVKI